MSPEEPKKEFTAVKGTRDILPPEVEDWKALEALAAETFETYGYRELRAPIFEVTELFEKGTGETSDVVTKEMYTFIDKGGRSITLRPEYTPSVVRAVIEHRLDLRAEPMRYYYMGPMFRYDKPQKGRFRQFHQIDIEVFGEKGPAIDAEIVEMAHALLGKLDIRKTETLVNSVGCRNCRPAYGRDLKRAAKSRLADLCPDCQRKAETNPFRIFDCKIESCREISASFPLIQAYLCPACRKHFEEFLGHLARYGIGHRLEPRLVRGLDYYTKTTFEIVSPELGAQNSLLGGGRYDDLMKDYGGPDIPAIGFAMGMERTLSAARIPRKKGNLLYIAALGPEATRKGMELARMFRGRGIETLIEFKDRGMKALLGRASKLEAVWTLVIGDEELRQARFGLKEMSTGRQTDGTPEELLRLILKSQELE